MGIDAFLHLIVFACTVLMGVLAFIGVRIFKNIDMLNESIQKFQSEIDHRIDNFRRDFDTRCDTVHKRINLHSERIVKLETQVKGSK